MVALGQLSECLEHLGQLIYDPSSALSYELVWLAELLKSIGQEVVR